VADNTGDPIGLGNALCQMGVVRWTAGDQPGAAEVTEEALGIYRDMGVRRRYVGASALGYLAVIQQLTGGPRRRRPDHGESPELLPLRR
jgi:hypothetical protein